MSKLLSVIAISVFATTGIAYGVSTPNVTLQVTSLKNGTTNITTQSGSVNATDGTVHIAGNLASFYSFPAITKGNYGEPQALTNAPKSFSIYVDNLTNNVAISLKSSDMVDNSGHSIPYEIVYTTCASYSTGNRAMVDLTNSTATDGISCSNHTCIIPNQFASKATCVPGSQGYLTITRDGVTDQPPYGSYKGNFVITANEA